MIGTIFLVLILFLLAWAAWQFLPPPFGVIVAGVVALLALYLLVVAVIGDDPHVRRAVILRL